MVVDQKNASRKNNTICICIYTHLHTYIYIYIHIHYIYTHVASSKSLVNPVLLHNLNSMGVVLLRPASAVQKGASRHLISVGWGSFGMSQGYVG